MRLWRKFIPVMVLATLVTGHSLAPWVLSDIASNLTSSGQFSAVQSGLLDSQFSSAIPQSMVPATNSAINVGSSSKAFETVWSESVSRPPLTPTLAATPVAATNQFYPGLNIVPTIAANVAAFIGPATPVPGQEFIIVNEGANAIRAKAAGGATLNGATAGGYISIASKATVQCFTETTGNQVCLQPVIPTPAGP